ncbi:DNA methylase N-4/N-6 domain protein [Geomicrobium sp. JCM 19037]|nr:DNA methylase N-4/N-6 domain protein [Geomicrobium sp. JCM 19037]
MDLNIIHKEDCLDGLRKLPDECIDLIFTSPPYAERRKSVYGGVHHTEYVDWFMVISAELKRVLKPTAHFL